jgi:hypothetical protein
MKSRHRPSLYFAWILLAAGPTATASTLPGSTPPEAYPDRLPAGVAPTLTALEANGFRVTLDTLGFKQDRGYELFRGHYFRLAAYSAHGGDAQDFGGGFTFSLLVDDLPKKVTDLKSLFTHFIVNHKLTDRLKDGSLQPVPVPRSTGGILFRYPQRLPVPATISRGGPSEITQWQWYFESIRNGKWFEIHFSRGVPLDAPVPEGVEAGIVRIVRSLQFPAATPADYSGQN